MIQYLTILLEAKKSKMDERGASAVEYGLLVAGIAALIVDRRLRASVASCRASSATPPTRSRQQGRHQLISSS